MDRDSYRPGGRGELDFHADARAVLAAVRAFTALDQSLDISAGSEDSQYLLDGARRSMAASAVDELGAACDLLADVAQEIGAPIERDLRDAKRLIDMIYAEPVARPLPLLRAIETHIADAGSIPEFGGGRPASAHPA